MDDFKKKLVVNGVIYAAIIFAVGGGMFFLSYRISGLVNSITALRVENLKRGREFELLSVLRNESVKAGPMLQKLRSILPVRDNILSFRKSMTDLAAVKQLKSFGFSFGSENVTEGALSSVSFEIAFSGTSAQVVDFIKSVETSGYVIKVIGVETGGASDKTNGRLTGQVFYK